MGKTSRFIVNVIIFLVVIGFIAYIVSSVNTDETTSTTNNIQEAFVSSIEKVKTLEFPFEITHFELVRDTIFLTSSQTVFIYHPNGEKIRQFQIQAGCNDIAVDKGRLFVLYPTFVAVYTTAGDSLDRWEACSEQSDYCALTLTSDFAFVTDVQNKNICQYTRDGNFVRFIFSPHGFLIPSYSFDISNHNDTVYAVNSGRHLIESYTREGSFIASFGGSGTESGFFAGCCNPAFISIGENGEFFTSEKGNPRVSIFSKNGEFGQVLLNNQLLGGGYEAYRIDVDSNHLFVCNKKLINIYALKK